MAELRVRPSRANSTVDTSQLETIQEQVRRALAGVSSQQGTAKITATDDQFRASVRHQWVRRGRQARQDRDQAQGRELDTAWANERTITERSAPGSHWARDGGA